MDKSPKPIANIAPFGLRMQPALREKVQSAADANARSLNQEIVNRLEQSLNPSQNLSGDITQSLLGALSRQDLLLKSSAAHLELVSTLTLYISSCVTAHALELVNSGQHLEKPLALALEQIKIYIESGYVVSPDSNSAQNTLESAVSDLTGSPMLEPLKSRDDYFLAESVAQDLEKLGYKPKQIGADPYATAKAVQKVQDLQKRTP